MKIVFITLSLIKDTHQFSIRLLHCGVPAQLNQPYGLITEGNLLCMVEHSVNPDDLITGYGIKSSPVRHGQCDYLWHDHHSIGGKFNSRPLLSPNINYPFHLNHGLDLLWCAASVTLNHWPWNSLGMQRVIAYEVTIMWWWFRCGLAIYSNVRTAESWMMSDAVSQFFAESLTNSY